MAEAAVAVVAVNEVRWFTRMILAAAVLAVLWADMARAQDITVVNRSAGITNAEVAAAVPALQTQITRDLAPVWGATANLSLADSTHQLRGWTLTLTDTGPAFALGYHDVGRKHRRPFAVVNMEATGTTDVPWTVVASHELLEMLVDPWVNLTARSGDRFYYVEVADPVEADWYDIDGVTVSDFVFPSWYSRRAPPPYDYLGRVESPFQLMPGGYDAYVQDGRIVIEA